jgi:hypothetical protein
MVLFRIFIPIEGRHHDAGMLMESNVLAQMANHMVIYFLFMVTLHTQNSQQFSSGALRTETASA